jgi:hypothetical protein
MKDFANRVSVPNYKHVTIYKHRKELLIFVLEHYVLCISLVICNFPTICTTVQDIVLYYLSKHQHVSIYMFYLEAVDIHPCK